MTRTVEPIFNFRKGEAAMTTRRQFSVFMSNAVLNAKAVFGMVAVLLLAASPLRAEVDYSLGFGTQTVPRGSGFNAQFGYGQLLWGDNGNGQVLYGYVRPVMKINSSLVVNRAAAEMQLAPLSFVVLSGGALVGNRNFDIATVDCSSVECRGSITGSYTGATLFFGAGPLGGGLQTKTAWLRPLPANDLLGSSSGATRDFADEFTALAAHAGGDQLVTQQAFVTWRLNEIWRVGSFTSRQTMTESQAWNRSTGVFALKNESPWTFTGGAGIYESITQKPTINLFFEAMWTGVPSIELH